MKLQNGYKVIYEEAKNKERTLFASKSNEYPTADDDTVVTLTEEQYKGHTIYEYKGDIYISGGKVPAYNEDGTPADGETQLKFNVNIFKATENDEGEEPTETATVNTEAEEPAGDNTETNEQTEGDDEGNDDGTEGDDE